MDQLQRYEQFAALHQPGVPVVLVNIWDAGSARAVVAGGAVAVATGSASVAGALGCADGEELPMEWSLQAARRIVAAVHVPLTLDFEGGYAQGAAELSANAASVVETGAVGLNFEDQVVGSSNLYDVAEQATRVAALRSGAGSAFWINARTDVFLKAKPDTHDMAKVDQALRRGDEYAKAGADSLFVPGLRDLDLIRSVCERSSLPVNILMFPDMATRAELAQCGVARISHGPFPWVAAMAAVAVATKVAMS
ncbi:2-Methylisocitrate lyase, PEP mutase family [Monaibacterium marinum]|uniref:2-Methylisocitrate lyase, PEP mutase family n=1 Tax=Pontivivens marinum TaxID=1690039 RepID=A0A2C9CP90_9RHOB|nr:isocitrate lyase/phosphoenolpyruvate mutase family protein [Monaibacterium marinum]SOH93038.1 2-Methylisocitrate lyase, PEP mutase family [Monaibacterium marinum]